MPESDHGKQAESAETITGGSPSTLHLPSLPHILVVEDEAGLRKLIALILGTNGLRYRTAGSVRDARKKFQSEAFDIVFLDIGLPDGSGFDVLEEVRSCRPETIIIMITGVHDLNTAIDSIRRGAFDYIKKPFSVALFQERLNTVMDEWKKRVFTRAYEDVLKKLIEQGEKQRRKTEQQIEHVYDMTVRALGAALDLKDPETEEHCRRVSENSILIGEKLGIRGQELKDLEWGAYLHDIGKIGVPERVLLKNGPLTDDEMEIVKKHSLLGYSMVKHIDFLSGAGDVVLYHHEKFDGSGYPYAKRGNEIPLHARIFAIADAFDAMVVDRPYRKAMPFEAIVEEIVRCSGLHFDPQLVKVFRDIPRVEINTGSNGPGEKEMIA